MEIFFSITILIGGGKNLFGTYAIFEESPLEAFVDRDAKDYILVTSLQELISPCWQ